MMRFLAISQNTFTQTIRQPIYAVVILGVFGVLVLTLPLSGWTVGNEYHASDQLMLQVFGLANLGAAGLLLAAFSASSVLAREIEDRTALTVVSKPISRSTFVLGKFAGVSAAVAVGFYLCSIVFLLTVRHKVMSAVVDPYDWPVITLGLVALGLTIGVSIVGNLVFGWHVTSTAVWSGLVLFTAAFVAVLFLGKDWVLVQPGYDVVPKVFNPEGPVITAKIVTAVLMNFMAVMVITAVAVAASTRFGTLMTLMICIAVGVLGSMHPWFQKMGNDIPALKLLALLLPNLTYFFAVDAVADPGVSIPLNVVGLYALYAVVFIAAVLGLGIAAFETRELDSQEGGSSVSGSVGVMAWVGRVLAVTAIAAGVMVLSVILKPYFANTPMTVPTLRLLCVGLPLAVGGMLAWLLWGYFARGLRWSYYAVHGILDLSLAGALGALLIPALQSVFANALGDNSGGYLMLDAIVDVVGLIILALPHTRQHFGFIKKRPSRLNVNVQATEGAAVSNHE